MSEVEIPKEAPASSEGSSKEESFELIQTPSDDGEKEPEVEGTTIETIPTEEIKEIEAQEDAPVKQEEIQELELNHMPGFRFTWIYSNTSVVPDATFSSNNFNRLFVRSN